MRKFDGFHAIFWLVPRNSKPKKQFLLIYLHNKQQIHEQFCQCVIIVNYFIGLSSVIEKTSTKYYQQNETKF